MNLFTIIARKRNPYEYFNEQILLRWMKLLSKLVGRVPFPHKNKV